jgi:hypothetical protein
MFSHVFAIRGSPKEEDGNWVKDETWLRDHRDEYDASYQQKEITEQEYVEHLYHLQQARGLLELREKTQDTMRGAVKWTDPYTWPVRKQVDKYVTGQYEPKEKNSRTQDIGLVQLVVGTYKKVEVNVRTNQFEARLTPMRIEHSLLHPHVNGPTRESKTWKPENTLNWWGTFGADSPFVFGTERVNAVSKNHYTSVVPGYLSIKSDYTKLSPIIPSPTQVYVNQ